MSRIFLFDVDGTLTDSHNRLIPGCISQLRRLVERGDTLALASGNVIPYMVSLRTFLGINGPVFGENGGIVYDSGKLELFGTKERPYRYYHEISSQVHVEGILSNKWREVSMAFRLVDSKEFPENIHVDPDVELTNSGFAWHILNKGLNKSRAVKFLAEKYHCASSEIVVFGDSDNDAAMMEGTNGITFAGAHPALKGKAKHIIETDSENWILEALSSVDDLL